MKSSTVSEQSLGAFFAGYRKKSLLPEPVLDYMLDVYKARNAEPLAGHGSLNPPQVNAAQATVLCQLTKAILRIERSEQNKPSILARRPAARRHQRVQGSRLRSSQRPQRKWRVVPTVQLYLHRRRRRMAEALALRNERVLPAFEVTIGCRFSPSG